MSIPEKHQLKIAKSTIKLSCIGAKIMGGMSHIKAIEVIKTLTGKREQIDNDCTCS